MNARFLGVAAVFIAFTAYTIWALMQVGYVGLLMNPLPTVGGLPIGPLQIGLDLVIMAVFVLIWMVRDAQQRGLNPWPFVAITLPLGSIGPLLYLLRREWSAGD